MKIISETKAEMHLINDDIDILKHIFRCAEYALQNSEGSDFLRGSKERRDVVEKFISIVREELNIKP